MTKRKRKVDPQKVMRAVNALNKIELDDADYRQLARDLKITRSRVKIVVEEMHPHVIIQRT